MTYSVYLLAFLELLAFFIVLLGSRKIVVWFLSMFTFVGEMTVGTTGVTVTGEHHL